MKRDLIKRISSSFLSCEKDTETILKKLFVSSQPHSTQLKKLLVINTKDCLQEGKYDEIIKNYDLSRLIEEQYVRIVPKLMLTEHDEARAYLYISFSDFTPNATNPEFRDCSVSFDIVCHTDYWDIGDYRLRPLKILGIIDGILNNEKLSGIGTFNFLGATNFTLDETFAGYTLMYRAIHGSDDKIPPQE